MTDRPGDDFLREHGIALPCAKEFGWSSWSGTTPSQFANCDRPYGHTGAHLAESFILSGGRDASDDERTNAVLRQIAERRTP